MFHRKEREGRKGKNIGPDLALLVFFARANFEGFWP